MKTYRTLNMTLLVALLLALILSAVPTRDIKIEPAGLMIRTDSARTPSIAPPPLVKCFPRQERGVIKWNKSMWSYHFQTTVVIDYQWCNTLGNADWARPTRIRATTLYTRISCDPIDGRIRGIRTKVTFRDKYGHRWTRVVYAKCSPKGYSHVSRYLSARSTPRTFYAGNHYPWAYVRSESDFVWHDDAYGTRTLVLNPWS